MIIKKLILYKYKRLFLNNITKLTYTPISNIQIILGSNGSGKSSLLSMLNPLPADLKRDFEKDGYKYIEIEYKGKLYIISSGYVSPNKHSFILDNVELNPGGTRLVQLQLVEEHFKITPYNNSILLGITRLTNISSSERKKIFTDISNTDYTYALDIYNKLKQRHRDIVGSIKLHNESLIKLESNILPKEKLDKYNTDISYLKTMIEHLTSIYNHTVDNNVNIDNNISILNNIVNNYINLVNEYNVYPYDVNKLLEDKIVIETMIKNITNDINTIKEKITKLLEIPTNTNDLESITKEINNLLIDIDKINSSNYLNLDLNNIDKIKDLYLNNISTILSILDDLSKYTDVSCKIADIDKQSLLVDNLKLTIAKINNNLDIYNKKKNELLSLKNDDNIVVCSNCGYKWYYKYDDNELQNIEKTITKLNNSYTKTNDILNKENDILARMKYKLTIINSLKELMLQLTELKPIWNYIIENYDLHGTNITSIVTEFNKITSYMNYWSNYSKYNKRLLELNAIKEKLITIEVTNRNNINSTILELEKELSDKISTLNKLINNKDIISKKYTIATNLVEYVNDIKKLLKNINNNKKNLMDIIKNKELVLLITDLKNILTEYEHIVFNNKSLDIKIANIKQELDVLNNKEYVLRLLVKELSPNEGLIAKSLNSFLNIFLKDMNTIINTVWSYQMEILPFDITENEDLDYKFPVKVNNSEVIEDVSKLSSSMMEIVDLAFRITYIKYAKLQHCPLILDEFGRTFDSKHRMYGYDIIDKILSNNFKQIFIVSHFEESYLRFSHGDISILNTDNINITNINKYNEILYLE